jgi:hypothetical protein
MTSITLQQRRNINDKAGKTSMYGGNSIKMLS